LKDNVSDSSLLADKMLISKIKEKKTAKKIDSELFMESVPKRERKVKG
jgi:hypothetical protein